MSRTVSSGMKFGPKRSVAMSAMTWTARGQKALGITVGGGALWQTLPQ